MCGVLTRGKQALRPIPMILCGPSDVISTCQLYTMARKFLRAGKRPLVSTRRCDGKGRFEWMVPNQNKTVYVWPFSNCRVRALPRYQPIVAQVAVMNLPHPAESLCLAHMAAEQAAGGSNEQLFLYIGLTSGVCQRVRLIFQSA